MLLPIVPYGELDALAKCNVRKRRNVINTPIRKLLTEQACWLIVAALPVGLAMLWWFIEARAR